MKTERLSWLRPEHRIFDDFVQISQRLSQLRFILHGGTVEVAESPNGQIFHEKETRCDRDRRESGKQTVYGHDAVSRKMRRNPAGEFAGDRIEHGGSTELIGKNAKRLLEIFSTSIHCVLYAEFL